MVASSARKWSGGAARSGRGGREPAGKPETPAASTDQDRDPDRMHATLRALQRENATQRLLVTIHDRLGALVLQGADVAAITTALAELIDRTVLLLDPMLRVLAVEREPALRSAAVEDTSAALWEPNEAYVSRVLDTMAGERRPLRLPALPLWGVRQACVIAPVAVGDAIPGYLAILEPEASDDEEPSAAETSLLAAQHAASVYAVALLRAQMATEVAAQLKDELLEGLMLGEVADEQAAHERARRLGYDELRTYRVLVLAPERAAMRDEVAAPENAGWTAARRRRLLSGLAEVVRSHAPMSIISTRGDDLVVLAPDGGPSAADLGRAATLHVAALYPEQLLTAGISGLCRAPTEIARSYAQARRTVDVARRFGRRGEVVSFDELGLYRLLFQVSDPAELSQFVEDVLGALLAYDRRHQTDFVRTLSTYLANNNSLQATARAMTVHVNTVTYRMQRVQEITGLNLTQADQSLLARVALKILDGGEGGSQPVSTGRMKTGDKSLAPPYGRR